MKNKIVLKNKNISKHEMHPFHILPPSYLPFFMAMSIGLFISTFAFLLHRDTLSKNMSILCFIIPEYKYLYYFFLCIIIFMCIWVKHITKEATFKGDHTRKVQVGLRYGMVLFIMSEVMFFFSFF
jgi:cytochrome c oxidase subunit 3